MQKIYGKTVKFVGDRPKYEFSPSITMLRHKSPKYEYETFSELRTLMAQDSERRKLQETLLEKLVKERACVLVLTDRVEEANNFKETFPDAVLMT